MKFKKLATLALSTMVVASMGSTAAFAATPQDNDTRNALDSAYLVKYLQMEEGVENPSEDFEFSFTATDSNNPAIGNVKINPSTVSKGKKDGGSVVGKKSISEIVGNTFNSVPAGVYSYEVKEVKGSKSGVSYSEEKYQLNIFVKNNTETGKTEIEGANVEKKTGPNEGKKVDPTIDDPTDPEQKENKTDDVTTTTQEVEGFSFTNSFTKDVEKPNDPTDDTKNGAFSVKKIVEGKYADKTNGFNFTLTLTAPATFKSNPQGGYEYIDAKGTKQSLEFGADKTWTATGLSLADTKSISFTKLPAGTTFELTEELTGDKANSAIKSADQYTPTVAQTIETGTVTGSGTKAANAKVSKGLISDSTNGNQVTYTNTVVDNDVTPTGIVINNLPYVLLIVIALGGIVLFTRKKREE